MNKRYAPLLLALTLASLGACTKRAVPTATRPTPPPVVVDEVKADNLEFRYLAAKARAQIETGGEKMPNANLTIRVRKDSVIWVSVGVSVLGEVLRAQITPDSVRVLDRLHRDYYAGDYAYLRERFSLPVTFQQLQALVAGNYLPPPAGATPTVSTEGPLQRVVYSQPPLRVEQLLETTRRRVQKLNVADDTTKLRFSVDYSDFKPLTPLPQQFAQALLVVVSPAKGGASSASINFRNVEVDKERLQFPFSVPSDYARKK